MRGLDVRPRYLVAKGGITSSDIATHALAHAPGAASPGQVLPGVPVWQAGPESRHPGLTYVVFPGNVGGDDALVQVLRRWAAGALAAYASAAIDARASRTGRNSPPIALPVCAPIPL